MKLWLHQVSFIYQKLIKKSFVLLQDLPKDPLNEPLVTGIKCIPQQGGWIGGEEIVIIMPNSIKRKGLFD